MSLPLTLRALVISIGLSTATVLASDPLPSWNDTPIKKSLLEFVATTTQSGSPNFVAPADRIAVFDNDGTLCVEQPMYLQFAFGVEQVKEQAAKHPEWKNQQPFQAALEDDPIGLGKTEIPGLTEIVAATHAGQTIDELHQNVNDWLATATHPSLHRPYTKLVYQPMLELMRYLEANGFTTYVVTGSVDEFLRAWTGRIYGIPPERVIGSSLVTTMSEKDGREDVVIQDGVGLINNKAGKAQAIERTIGRRPILAFGNSDGDLDMLRFTAGSKTHWTGLVHHTDGTREFLYDKDTLYGSLVTGLKDAAQNHWWILDMKTDWKTIFPPPARS